MTLRADCACQSLTKHHEELCGDKVELLHTDDSYIMILADGMGSGVKANILSTLTAKILGTMFLKGASLDECVETIVKTLPVCQVRHVAYSTFSILQVSRDGQAYLVEFDNPSCLMLRGGQIHPIPFCFREIAGKRIKEAHFPVQTGDIYLLVSDGVVHAGVGREFPFGWPWEAMANFAAAQAPGCQNASQLAGRICREAGRLYGGCPGDDTTAAVMRIVPAQVVRLMTGPPSDPSDDERIVEALMEDHACRIVCGGTSATIVARQLKRPLMPTLDFADPDIPPIAHLQGVDLVTEGVLTLNRAVALLRRYTAAGSEAGGSDSRLADDLANKNGGALLANILIGRCTDLHLLVGKAVNTAHQVPDLPFDLGARQLLVDQLKTLVQSMGKQATVTYF